MKVLVVGKVPPPIGGVTVFTKRHAAELAKSNEVDVFSDFRMSSLLKLPFIIKKGKYDSVYIHSYKFIIILSFIFFASRVSIVDHNQSSRNYHKSPNLWKVKCFLVHYFKEVLVVSDHLINYYPEFIRSNISVVSTFYPPTDDEVAECSIPDDILGYVNKGRFIVCTAWRLIFEEGKDLYGFDQAVELLKKLESRDVKINMIFCIGDSGYNSEYIEEIEKEISEVGLEDKVIFWRNCPAAWALFRFKGCIYFRPTLTDGNSVSIHEARYFGAKVLASNTVPRPDFVKTYDYPSVEDAFIKIRDILKLKG